MEPIEPEVTEYIQPYYGIWITSFVILLLVYLGGVPATVAVAAVLWRHRTRRRPAPRYVAAAAPPGGPGQAHPPGGPPPGRLPPTVLAYAEPPPTDVSVTGPVMAAPQPAGQAGMPGLPGLPGQPQLSEVERDVWALRGRPASPDAYVRLAGQLSALVAQHGAGSTVGRCATRLHAIVAALAPLGVTGVSPAEPPRLPALPTNELPDLLRVGLARLAATGQPIPPQWAYFWYGHQADWWPPGAYQRRAELARAFTRRYEDTFPYGGMIVALTGGKLVLPYPPAGVHSGPPPAQVATELPDVTGLPEAARRLRAVGDAAWRDLGS